jgi:hypothetical protein
LRIGEKGIMKYLSRPLKILASLFLLSIITAGGCSDSTSPKQNRDLIKGRVVDVDGKGIEGAKIVIDYVLEYNEDTGSEAGFFRKRKVGSELPLHSFYRHSYEEGWVRVWVERYCSNELIKVIIDTLLSEVNGSISWNGTTDDGKLAYPGVYNAFIYRETPTDTFYNTKDMLLKRDTYMDKEAGWIEANTSTGSNGYFELSQECLPFDYTVDWIDEYGVPMGTIRVTRYVNICVVHDSYTNAVDDSVYVDPDEGAETEIKMYDYL